MPRKKTEPDSKPIRVNEDVYDGVMVLSTIYKRSMPQFTSEVLRPIVAKLLADQGIAFPIQVSEEDLTETIKQFVPKVKPAKNKQGAAPGCPANGGA